MIPVTVTKNEYTPVPAGNHLGRIYSIIHIGTTLDDTPWGAKERNKVRITWELPNERREFKDGEGEKPYSISGTYTLNFGEKANLRKVVEGIFGRQIYDEEAAQFDVELLVGQTAMVNVTHRTKDGKTYANIENVTPVPKGMVIPEPVNKPLVLNYSDKWSEEAFESLPDFLKDQMRKTDEYRRKHPLENPDNIPF